MNISLFNRYENKYGKAFSAHIFNTYWAGQITDASGMFNEHTDDYAPDVDQNAAEKGYDYNGNWSVPSSPDSESTTKLIGEVSHNTTLLDTENIICAKGMFMGQNKIQSVSLDFPKLTDAELMFAYCRSLSSLEGDFGSLTGQGNTIANFITYANLESIRCNFSSLTNKFSLSNPSSLKTVECDFSSLENGDNFFKDCSNLANFDCELPSLNSAVNMCLNSKLTSESVQNIANKIKTHTDGEMHKIDLGLNCTTETFTSDFRPHVETLIEKGWTVTTTPSNIESAITYLSKEKTNSCNIVVDGTYNNNFEWTTYQSGMQGKKYGFAMGTDKDSYFNQITIKTHNDSSTPKKIFLQVHDENKALISSSSIVEIIENTNEYSFDFDVPFLMEKDKTYYIQFFGVDNNNNKINSVRKEVYIRCSVLSEGQYGYGVLHASEVNDWSIQWNGLWDGDYTDPHQLNAWCKFNLVEKTSDQTEPITNIETQKQLTTESANATIKSSSNISLSFKPSKELNDVQTIKVESRNQIEIIQSTYDTITNTANISFTSKTETKSGTFHLIISYCNSSNETIYKDYIKYTSI